MVPKLPNWFQFLLVALSWIAITYLSKIDIDVLQTMIQRETIKNATLALVAINLGLAVAVVGVGIYAELQLEMIASWALATAFYGFLTAGPIFKHCFKRRFHLDQEIG